MTRFDMALADQARWEAVARKDAGADGAFVYAVTTTGIYCRPSCPSRRPRSENVRFFATAAAAEHAGFRACKRCSPKGASADEQRRAQMLEACRIIDATDEPLSLQTLATRVGLSPFHFQRQFKSMIGLTPKQYFAERRATAMRNALKETATVTAAIYDAGYGSASRFYEKADIALGMSPRQFRDNGKNATLHFAIGQTSLGSVLVAQTEKGVCAILLGDDPAVLLRDLQDRFPQAELIGADTTYEANVARVVAMVEQPLLGLDLPLDLHGTVFQQKVWAALRNIPAGRTASYQEIADAIGVPRAVRAVAMACAANKLAVAVPCHRVVRSDGALSGYRWGVERKRALLQREKSNGSNQT